MTVLRHFGSSAGDVTQKGRRARASAQNFPVWWCIGVCFAGGLTDQGG